MNRLTNLWSMLLAFCVLFISCSDDEDGSTSPAVYTFVNAVTDSQPMDLYIGDVLQSDSNLAINFTSFLKNKSIAGGSQKFKVTAKANPAELYSETFNLSGGKNYTVAFINTVSSMDGIIIEDDFSLPDTNKSYIRIVHLSPNAGAVNFTSAKGIVVGTNIQFQKASAFFAIDPGKESFTITGQGINLALNNVTLNRKKYTTILLMGLKNATGTQALNYNFLPH